MAGLPGSLLFMEESYEKKVAIATSLPYNKFWLQLQPLSNNHPRRTDMTTISTDELRRRIDSGIPTVLVEALPRRHFDLGHLPGAINIPHDEISARAGADLPDKDAPRVVYCASRQCRY